MSESRFSSAASPANRWRVAYATLGCATIALGLLVHFRGAVLNARVHDATGDALWACMMAALISVVMPMRSRTTRCGAAFAICVLVECSQLLRTPFLDSIRANRIGQLVLGSGFDARDFVAYAVGVAAFAVFDWRIRR